MNVPANVALAVTIISVCSFAQQADAQHSFNGPSVVAQQPCGSCGSDLMDVRNFRLRDYREMFLSGRAPTASEMQGTWKGVNKGIVRLVGYKQFIKEIKPCGCMTVGDNVQVHQVSNELLRCCGWQPKTKQRTGQFRRLGKFVVHAPDCRGRFGHGVTFSYRDGGNGRCNPTGLIVDKVVMLDHNHMLGRATIRLGLVQIPVAYFMLERVH